MRADLLLLLADILDRVPRKRFDYTCWVGSDWHGMPDLSCGTTACALGWATTSPEIASLGLRLKKTYTLWPAAVVCDTDHGVVTAYSAAAYVFGISAKQAEYLFCPETRLPSSGKTRSPGDDATAQEVAAHIRAFVALTEGRRSAEAHKPKEVK